MHHILGKTLGKNERKIKFKNKQHEAGMVTLDATLLNHTNTFTTLKSDT